MNLEPGKRYSFSIYPSSIIDTNFSNVEVLMTMGLAAASEKADVVALAVAVVPYLPPGTITDPARWRYVRVRTPMGGEITIAYEWINAATITEVTNERIQIIVSNRPASDALVLRDLLLANNFNDIAISIV